MQFGTKFAIPCHLVSISFTILSAQYLLASHLIVYGPTRLGILSDESKHICKYISMYSTCLIIIIFGSKQPLLISNTDISLTAGIA